MAELKTKQNTASVTAFLAAVENTQQRSDARKLATMMRAATGSRAKMWGTSIVGFGSYHYKYASGQEGDWPIVGYSPRKQSLSICIKRLEDVDETILRKLIDASVKFMRSKYETRK